MAEEEWKSVSRRDKRAEDDYVDENKFENKLRNEGKLLIIRLEKVVRESDNATFNLSAAIQDAMKAMVNHNPNVKLLSLDGIVEMESLHGFSSKSEASNFFNVVKISQTNGIRYSALFKVTSNGTRFSELKHSEATLAAASKWNWIIRHHKLSNDQPDVRLAFNVFMINPHLVDKEFYAANMDSAIKQYAIEKIKKDTEFANRMKAGFCKWISNTTDKTIEVGVRKIATTWVNKAKKTIDISSVVLTISVEGRFLAQIKDIIKEMKWDVNKYGVLTNENPGEVHKHIELMYEHNDLCEESAYVKVTWLPDSVLPLKLPKTAPLGLDNAILNKTIANAQGKEIPLIRSINKIKSESGMYFLITTKELLDVAEKFITDIMTKVNKTTKIREDTSLSNPEKHQITVVEKNSSTARSEVSEFSTAISPFVVNESNPAVMRNRTSMKETFKRNNKKKGPPKSINCMHEIKYCDMKQPSIPSSTRPEKSYAKVLKKTIGTDEMIIDNPEGNTIATEAHSAQKMPQKTPDTIPAEEFFKLVEEVKNIKDSFSESDKMKDAKIKELEEENKMLKSVMERYSKEETAVKIGNLFMESPKPATKILKSKKQLETNTTGNPDKKVTVSDKVTHRIISREGTIQDVQRRESSIEILDKQLHAKASTLPKEKSSQANKTWADYNDEDEEEEFLDSNANTEDVGLSVAGSDGNSYNTMVHHDNMDTDNEDNYDKVNSNSNYSHIDEESPSKIRKRRDSEDHDDELEEFLEPDQVREKEEQVPKAKRTSQNSKTMLSPQLKRLNMLQSPDQKKPNAVQQEHPLNMGTRKARHPTADDKALGKYV
jgi:hypothetical protein